MSACCVTCAVLSIAPISYFLRLFLFDGVLLRPRGARCAGTLSLRTARTGVAGELLETLPPLLLTPVITSAASGTSVLAAFLASLRA